MEGCKRRWSSPDTQSGKALRPTKILEAKSGSPLLMLSLEEGGYRVYSPEADEVYETDHDFIEYRLVANSGKWFLAIDSESNLSIVDVFSKEMKSLPPLESFKGEHFKVERVEGKKIFHHGLIDRINSGSFHSAEDLRGLLWVDERTGEYVVVWQFGDRECLGFCKKGDNHYREITTRIGVRMELRGLRDMILTGYNLYILTKREFIRQLDLSGNDDGFKDVSLSHWLPMWIPDMFCLDETRTMIGKKNISPDENIYNKPISSHDNIALVTSRISEKVLIVHNRVYESTTRSESCRVFRLYRRDSKDLNPETRDTRLVEVDTLGEEALFLDLGITVPAANTSIEPNSIYFTRDDHFCRRKAPRLDICVYNLAQKTAKRFSKLSQFKLKDAQWFIPY